MTSWAWPTSPTRRPQNGSTRGDTLAAFAELPAEQRAILLLVGVEGFSYREVADALEVPIGTVMSRLSRARDKLRGLSEGRASTPALRILK